MVNSCEFHLPPTFVYHFKHIFRGHAPTIYSVFIPIALVCSIVTCIVLIPRIIEYQKAGMELQRKYKQIYVPPAFRMCQLIIGFPIIISLCKLMTLISPITAYTMEFIARCYEGLCLYWFASLLIMYLGSLKALKESLSSAKPAKFWASPPFGCCFKCVCKAKNMTINDFRIVYKLILQYAILAPLLSFVSLFRSYQNDTHAIIFLNVAMFLSAFICIYALFALMRASESVLHGHRIHGKFWCIKMAVFMMILPHAIIDMTSIPSFDEVYNEETLIESISAFITVVLLAFLSFMCRAYFQVNDATNAHTNVLALKPITSQHEDTGTIMRRFSRVDIMDDHNSTENENEFNNENELMITNGNTTQNIKKT